MKHWHILLGPTVMIFIGLQMFENLLITFVLFYGWLFFVPLLSEEPLRIGLASHLLKRSVMIGSMSGIIFFLFVFLSLYGLHQYFIDIRALQSLLVKWGFSGYGIIGFLLVFVFVNPILEEVYWRGFVFERLSRSENSKKVIVVTALFYTLYHFLSVMPMFQSGMNLLVILFVFIGGLYWGYMRDKIGSIIGTILCHAFADLGIVCVYWFLVR